MPRNRDECEIAGYRDVLNIVHENFEYIPLTPNYILQPHKILMSYTASGFGGTFKNVQSYISATDESGKRFTLFTPLAPHETPETMQEICDEYNHAVGAGKVDPLLIIAVFIHDFHSPVLGWQRQNVSPSYHPAAVPRRLRGRQIHLAGSQDC